MNPGAYGPLFCANSQAVPIPYAPLTNDVFLGSQAETPPLTTDINFWTPERCKTLSTEVLIDNMGDFLKQAQAAKTQQLQARSIYLAQMIDAELRTRF